jgi:hypothetical protein
MRLWWGPLCTRPTCLVGLLYSLSSLKCKNVLCCFTSDNHNNCYAGSSERHLSELKGQKKRTKTEIRATTCYPSEQMGYYILAQMGYYILAQMGY